MAQSGFDRLTASLGGAGQWLRGHGGRTLLGYSGVVLFFVGIGLVLQGLDGVELVRGFICYSRRVLMGTLAACPTK